MNHELDGADREVAFAAATAAARHLLKSGMDLGGELHEASADAWAVRASPKYVPVGDRLVTKWLEVDIHGDPSSAAFRGRLEVRDGIPRVVAFGFHSGPGIGEVRQSDLRSAQVASLLQLMAAFSLSIDVDADGQIDVKPGVFSGELSQESLENIKGSRTNRKVTPEFLREVAAVYRANIKGSPTLEVSKRFFVSQRMASTYVSRAREAKLLPKTDRGKKKA